MVSCLTAYSPVLLAGRSGRHCVRCPRSLIAELATVEGTGRGGLDVGRRRRGRGCGRGLRGSRSVLHAGWLPAVPRWGPSEGSLVAQLLHLLRRERGVVGMGKQLFGGGEEEGAAGGGRWGAVRGCGQRERQEARGTLCGRGCLHQLGESE